MCYNPRMENLPKPPGLPADVAHVKVALLIDADNVGDKHADDLMKKAAFYGNVIVRRAYGVMSNFQWKQEALHRYAITPVACPVYVSKKNTTDIMLAIDAMDLTRHQNINTVCIASNDSDFSPLAMKLREYGIAVYGFGNEKAQKSFIASCDGFNYLSTNSEESDADSEKPVSEKSDTESSKTVSEKPNTPPKKTTNKKLIKNLTDACTEYGDNDGWAYMGAIVNYLKRINPEFSPKNYGHAKFKKLIESLEGFEVDEIDGKTQPKMRIKETPKKKK